MLDEEIGQCGNAALCEDSGQLKVNVIQINGKLSASYLFEGHMLWRSYGLVALTNIAPLIFGRVRNIISMPVEVKRNRTHFGNREIPFFRARQPNRYISLATMQRGKTDFTNELDF